MLAQRASANKNTYRGVRTEAIANGTSIYHKIPNFRPEMEPLTNSNKWNENNSWLEQKNSLRGTFFDLAWMLGWTRVTKLMYGYDDGDSSFLTLRDDAITKNCSIYTSYISGFATTDTFEYYDDTAGTYGTNIDWNKRCACYNTTVGDECSNAVTSCSMAPPQRSFREHFRNQLFERGDDKMGYEVDKAFTLRSEEPNIDNIDWIDDVTDRFWAAPFIDDADAFSTSGSYQTLFWGPDEHNNGNLLNSTKHSYLDEDHFAFFGTYGVAYSVNAYSWNSATGIRIQIVNEDDGIVADTTTYQRDQTLN